MKLLYVHNHSLFLFPYSYALEFFYLIILCLYCYVICFTLEMLQLHILHWILRCHSDLSPNNHDHMINIYEDIIFPRQDDTYKAEAKTILEYFVMFASLLQREQFSLVENAT